MDKRRLFVTVILIVMGVGVCISTSAFSGKKTIAIETSPEMASTDEMKTESSEAVEQLTSFPVYICGEVLNPGVYDLEYAIYLYELIEMAGGLSKDAAVEHIDMVYYIDSPQSIFIPSILPEADGMDTSLSDDEQRWTPASGTGTSSARRVNINRADAVTLASLSGIGEKTAEKIVAYREENGPFATTEDIMNVSGIGQSKYNAIKDEICV